MSKKSEKSTIVASTFKTDITKVPLIFPDFLLVGIFLRWFLDKKKPQSSHSLSQSAPTILVLKTWVGLWPWKKLGPKYGVKKVGCKKQGHYYSKREEDSCLFSFWITMTFIFCTQLFAPHILDPVFLKFQTLKKYQVDLIN